MDDSASPALTPLDPFSVSCVFEVWLATLRLFCLLVLLVQRRQRISDATTHHIHDVQCRCVPFRTVTIPTKKHHDTHICTTAYMDANYLQLSMLMLMEGKRRHFAHLSNASHPCTSGVLEQKDSFQNLDCWDQNGALTNENEKDDTEGWRSSYLQVYQVFAMFFSLNSFPFLRFPRPLLSASPIRPFVANWLASTRGAPKWWNGPVWDYMIILKQNPLNFLGVGQALSRFTCHVQGKYPQQEPLSAPRRLSRRSLVLPSTFYVCKWIPPH